ncbi:molybdopterin-binding protein [Natrinema sp. 1APR25-10V2]|uniref:MogA/MoaB family molybdenum cofactor biosynthesis protein n=1 Tax=Natrinema sp. 1APR25-10V2 TaxID=2951081 RepID=UPI002875641D|nr:molybdopterin-binding protein [Natrinema sp. 1APR25-10V2]MDS0473407.1 molybdopterin-binding protein [Natrinema sp. 1APR25-10V2]
MNETDADETRDGADAGGGRDTAPDDLCTSVVTISSDRSLEEDPAGDMIATVLEEAGHEIAVREHVGSAHDKVQSIVSRQIDRDDVDIVITAGGTSVEPDDVTLEAVEPLLEKELTPFGELFTALAYERVGTRVVTARTLAGIAKGSGTPVFCLPGVADVARIGLEEIVLSEAAAIVDLAREDEPDTDEDAPEADATNGGA